MEWIAISGSLVGILTFVFSTFHFVVLKPLKESITDLKDLIDKVEQSVKDDEKVRHELEIKVATLEQRINSLNSKLDIITKFCMKSHNSQEVMGLITQLNEDGN